MVKAVCMVSGEGIKGKIIFEQADEKSQTQVNYNIEGLKAGDHGFHVHEFGDLSNGCTSAGPHWNPEQKDHGGREDEERHHGDFGNITATEGKPCTGTFSDKLVQLIGSKSIIGRSIVIHADKDDLGKTDHALSKTTGNSGARVACGIIGIADQA